MEGAQEIARPAFRQLVTWRSGCAKFAGLLGRWMCPHRHCSPEAALRCAVREARRLERVRLSAA